MKSSKTSTTTSQSYKAVIYARYSSAGQRDESIEGQIRECKAYAESKGYDIIDCYIDKALTATTDKRPGFQKMISDSSKRIFTHVICWKHDRFARNRYDAAIYKAKLKQNGVSIVYAKEDVPDGAQGVLMDSIMEGFAEYYSVNLSENVKRGQYESAIKGYTLGVNILGYKVGDDKRYMIDESTAPLVKYIFEQYAAGVPERELRKELNDKGYRTYTGSKFTPNCIPRIIHNEKYKGVYRFNDIVDENGIPPIVSRDLWQRANDICVARHKAPARADLNGGYILSGKLFCGHCGGSMTAGTGTGKSGKKYDYYTCNGKRSHNGCTKKNIPKDLIENRVIDLIREVVFSDEIIEMFVNRYDEWMKEQERKSELPLLKSRMKDLDKRISNMYSVLEQHPELKQTIQRITELENERNALDISISEASMDLAIVTKDDVKAFLYDFRKGNINDPNWRNYIVKTFVNKVYAFDDGKLTIYLNYANDNNDYTVNMLETIETDGELLCSNFNQSPPPSELNTNTCLYFVCGCFVITDKPSI